VQRTTDRFFQIHAGKGRSVGGHVQRIKEMDVVLAGPLLLPVLQVALESLRRALPDTGLASGQFGLLVGQEILVEAARRFMRVAQADGDLRGAVKQARPSGGKMSMQQHLIA
jgi:hypothetical protein